MNDALRYIPAYQPPFGGGPSGGMSKERGLIWPEGWATSNHGDGGSVI